MNDIPVRKGALSLLQGGNCYCGTEIVVFGGKKTKINEGGEREETKEKKTFERTNGTRNHQKTNQSNRVDPLEKGGGGDAKT